MVEERWHDFAKEKPSEDMEGRNFIVSNGHYEKIATWCGYWENEPFMGDHLCDEVVRWKFYFTSEEEKANEATRTEPKAMKCDELKRKYSDITGPYYGYNEVNEAIAELKAENERLKKCEIWMKQHFYCEEVIACESAKNRQLKRALWLARAMRAEAQWNRQLRDAGIAFAIGENKSWDSWNQKQKKWQGVERKCRAKAKEYK